MILHDLHLSEYLQVHFPNHFYKHLNKFAINIQYMISILIISLFSRVTYMLVWHKMKIKHQTSCIKPRNRFITVMKDIFLIPVTIIVRIKCYLNKFQIIHIYNTAVNDTQQSNVWSKKDVIPDTAASINPEIWTLLIIKKVEI